MPSSEDMIAAQGEVFDLAVKQKIREGHPERSAKEIVQALSYDARVRLAEKIKGPIYRGPYSTYS